MSYPCEMIKDLLPLFEDEVCSEESRRAVEEHLQSCEECRSYAAALHRNHTLAPAAPDEGDSQMAASLRRVRKKLDRRKRRMLAGALAAVVVVAAAYQALFVLPLKSVSLKDISVSAEVYPISELEKTLASDGEVQIFADEENESVTISKGETDNSEAYTVVIPALSDKEITLSGNVMEESGSLSVVTWSSPYFLREIRYDQNRPQDGDTLYVSGFKTTLLGNRAESYNTTISSMEFRPLERIVLVNADGSQQLLWKKGE